jgi:hypothetical protein
MDRIKLLNYLIITKGYEKYLEIGCAGNTCFNAVLASWKVGVDPVSGGTLRLISDEFFKVNCMNFDLVFIDGLHEASQAVRDVQNALKFLNPGGCIVLHDCLPKTEKQQDISDGPHRLGEWTGDIWKAIAYFRTFHDLDTAVGDFDWGCGVIFKRANSHLINLNSSWDELIWDDFVRHGKEWLRVMDVESCKKFIDGS